MSMVKCACISVILFSIFSNGAMDDTQPIRVGLVPIDTENGIDIYTKPVLLQVLRPVSLAAIDEMLGRLCTIGGYPVWNYAFQKDWYDKRQAALAAHIILQGGIYLPKKKSISLYAALKALDMQRMAIVVDAAYIYNMFKPSIAIFEDEDSSLPEQERRVILQKNAPATFCGLVAYCALQSAISEGADLIDLDVYKQITQADSIEEYITNEQLR